MFYDRPFQKGSSVGDAYLPSARTNFPVLVFSTDWSLWLPDDAIRQGELLLSPYRDLFVLPVPETAYITGSVWFSPHEDSTHERAGGNLRYFEKLLEKEREEEEKEKPINKTVMTTEPVVQSGAYERPLDYLPERDIYEALCRGEGVKMVRGRQDFPDSAAFV